MGPKRRLSSLKDKLHGEAHRLRELPHSARHLPHAMEILGLRQQAEIPVDVFEREGSVVVRAEMAGIDPGDIDVAVVNGGLRISGARDGDEPVDEDSFLQCERIHGHISRTLPLPDGADADGIRATIANGLLEVVIPAAGSTPTKRIPVTQA